MLSSLITLIMLDPPDLLLYSSSLNECSVKESTAPPHFFPILPSGGGLLKMKTL